MATDGDPKSVTNTLSGTTADRITIEQLWPAVEVTNHDASDLLYVDMDGTATPTAVAAEDGATVVLPGATKTLRAIPAAPSFNTIVLSVVGDGGAYTVEGVQ